MRAIGLMSGTSMDGIDVALLETDGETVTSFSASMEVPYAPSDRRLIEQALEDAKGMTDRSPRPGCLAETEDMVTARHAEAVAALLRRGGMQTTDIDVIGFHGHTVLHRPEAALTVQLGDGQALADASGIDVVHDMRAADMIAGGQGAPLVPVFHQALAGAIAERPIAFVNIGGISNITFIGADGPPVAFDCGPGNALIDQWVQTGAGVPFDSGGAIASEGGVLASVVERYMAAPFFDASVPKSLDRFDFPPLDPQSAGLHDGARTLAYVTAKAIHASIAHLPEPPKLWLLCGGGRHNRFIVSDLASMVGDATVEACDAHGLDGDMMEAQAFAYLAVRSLRRLPLTFPTTTGCKEPVTGGLIARTACAP